MVILSKSAPLLFNTVHCPNQWSNVQTATITAIPISMNTMYRIIRNFLLTIAMFLSALPSTYGKDRFLEPGEQNHLLLILPLFLLALALFYLSKRDFRGESRKELGFLSITPHRSPKFFSISEEIHDMEKVVDYLADEQTNVYSNLSKITLAVKPTGVFLEDKNYKISILVNRRRSRRCFLNDGDIIDMGELTMVFHSPLTRTSKLENQKQKSTHLIPRVRRAQGKLIRQCPTLIPSDHRKKTFYLTKNITFIGRSESNDLVPKAKGVSLRHSKIEKVAGRYKLIDLQSANGTFVNGKRVECKFLRDGDEISFESVKYSFSSTGKTQ